MGRSTTRLARLSPRLCRSVPTTACTFYQATAATARDKKLSRHNKERVG